MMILIVAYFLGHPV